jgi:hypothetical protein
VPSANEYREPADKCFQSAREAHSEDERMMYFTLTQTCAAIRRRSCDSHINGLGLTSERAFSFLFRPRLFPQNVTRFHSAIAAVLLQISNSCHVVRMD